MYVLYRKGEIKWYKQDMRGLHVALNLSEKTLIDDLVLAS